MSSRSKWEDMTSFPSELAGAIKQARSDIAKREASEKAKQYEQEADARSSKTSASEKKQEASSDENRFSLEKIKARNRMMSDL